MRMCIATGVKKPKQDLIRLVRIPAGDGFIVQVDQKGKERGRGANIDKTLEAFDLAVKKGAIERSLKLDKKLTADEVAQLRKDFEQVIEEKLFRDGNKPVKIKVKKQDLLKIQS